MRWPWSWCARAAIPACLLCCLASVAVHRARLPALAAARAAHEESVAEVGLARTVLSALEALPPADARASGRAGPVERELARLAAFARAAGSEHAVTIDALAAVAAATAASAPVPMASLVRPLPMTGGRLRAAAVTVRGRYGHLHGLMAWFDEIRMQPAVMTSFSASGQRFEVHLWVIGT